MSQWPDGLYFVQVVRVFRKAAEDKACTKRPWKCDMRPPPSREPLGFKGAVKGTPSTNMKLDVAFPRFNKYNLDMMSLGEAD